MANKAFEKAVGEWVASSKTRTLAVIKESVKEVTTKAQRPIAQGGSMPVVTGNMRNSLIVALNGSVVGKGATSYTNALPLMKLGDNVFVGWTAKYARRLEYGFKGADSLGRVYDQKGYGFLRLATQNWKMIVTNNARSFERAFRGSS